jgi:perosamine synthetase
VAVVPIASVDVNGNEEKYVIDAIRTTWISSTGAYLDRFEKEFAELCNSKSAIAVCNGTVALHLALLGMDIRPGDEVLVPSLTYIATANAVRYCGGEPVFIDVDPKTWCLDPEQIEASITRRTKGIIAVHLLGHPADMDSINRLAAIHGLWVVEDAAEAVMAKYKGRPAGNLARAGTFSFFGNKVFTSGEGGAVTVSDPQLETRMRMLRGQGMDPARRYFFPITGYNFRLTNVAAAFLCAQLERKEQIVNRRLEILAEYDQLLGHIPGIGLRPVAEWAELSPWMYSCTVDPEKFGATRDELAQKLRESNIDTRPMFIPLHSLPPFREESRNRKEYLPETDRLGSQGIMLPTFNQLSSDQIHSICKVIRDFHQEKATKTVSYRNAA